MSGKEKQQARRKTPGKRPRSSQNRRVRIDPKAAREAERERATEPLPPLAIFIRLLPVWALLIMILILEPALPLRAAGELVRWVVDLLPEPAAQHAAEPVFIVEGAEAVEFQSELPPPDWDLDISPIFTPEVQYWREDIARWSLTYRIKPNMIATLMQIESCGDPTAVSPAGALGLFQVLPLHFEEDEDPFDPETNARRGLIFFSEMLAAANGDVGLAFAAYNGGPSVLGVSPSEWESETQNYQYWGSGIYDESEHEFLESPTLIEWLEAGGDSLCAQAASVLGLDSEE